jgi:hypothetical protein
LAPFLTLVFALPAFFAAVLLAVFFVRVATTIPLWLKSMMRGETKADRTRPSENRYSAFRAVL